VFPTLRSLPDPGALRDELTAVYGIPFASCTLLRSLVNDVYELTANDEKYIAKLYRSGGWEPDEIRWETGLSAHLTASGVPVPRVRPLADGTEVGLLEAAEGIRPFILSEYVAGRKPEPPFTDDLYAEFGRLVARFHNATDTFSSSFPRRPSDLTHRLDDPLAEMGPVLGSAEENLLHDLATAVRNNVAAYTRPQIERVLTMYQPRPVP
jgi:Ser/Thr protein kinase RdoA (MazF antagonist)